MAQATIPFSRIRGYYPRALIVASGASVTITDWESYRFPPDVAVISVNQSIHKLPYVTHWVTIDPSKRNRQTMANPRPGVVYYAGVDPAHGTSDAPVPHWREAPVERGMDFIRRFLGDGYCKAKKGLSEDPRGVNTGNSGYAALGVAYLMGARKIAILGLDGYGGYWCSDPKLRPQGQMHHLPELFASAVPQLEARGIEVVNGSPKSAITCFPRTTPENAVSWLLTGRPHIRTFDWPEIPLELTEKDPSA